MTETTFAVLALLVLGWAVVSDLLTRANLTSPLVFMVAGYFLGNPDWGPLHLDVEAPSVHLVTELTLAFDHRVCDGETAAGFLRYVADCIENPGGALADM